MMKADKITKALLSAVMAGTLTTSLPVLATSEGVADLGGTDGLSASETLTENMESDGLTEEESAELEAVEELEEQPVELELPEVNAAKEAEEQSEEEETDPDGEEAEEEEETTVDEVETAGETDFDNPVKLELDKTLEGFLPAGSDSEYYSLTTDKNGAVSLEVASYFNGTVVVFNEKGDTLLSEEMRVSGSTYEKKLVFAVNPGKYIIRITSNSGGNYGSFSLRASLTDWDKEVSYTEVSGGTNNTWDKATALSLGTTMKGSFTLDDNTDWYRFTMSDSGRLEFSLSTSPYNVKMTMYHRDGDKEVEMDAWTLKTKDENGVMRGTLDSSLMFNAGTYYLKVEHAASSRSYGLYTLGVKGYNFRESVKETYAGQNNTLKTSSVINGNLDVRGLLTKWDTADCYTINIPKKATYDLVYDTVIPTSDLSIYSLEGKQLWTAGFTVEKGFEQTGEKWTRKLTMNAGDYILEVKGKSGNTGQYILKMAGLGNPSVKPEPSDELPFTDVKKTDWFYNYVKEANEAGLMTGLNETVFGPNEQMSRGMVTMVIWRMAGAPKVTWSEQKFPDVKKGEWYADAVMWCYQNGVVGGYETGSFGPNDPITREQMAKMLRDYAKFAKLDYKSTASLDKFKDKDKVSGFAKEPVAWAYAKGILTGANGETELQPTRNATRAECAKMLLVASKIK